MPDTAVVLLAEDDELVRQMVEDALTEGGFAVEAASTAERAIGMLDAPEAAYVALVTDINIGRGETNGWEVARRGRQLNPALAVVYMTGGAAADWAAEGVPNSVLIQKPFAPAQIVTAVAQLLNTGSPAP